MSNETLLTELQEITYKALKVKMLEAAKDGKSQLTMEKRDMGESMSEYLKEKGIKITPVGAGINYVRIGW